MRPTGGSSSLGDTVSKSTNYTITDSDNVRTVLITVAGVAIALPSAATNENRPITIIKKVSTNTASQITGTVNGVVNPDLDFKDEAISVVSDGSTWSLENHYIPCSIYTPVIAGTNLTSEYIQAQAYKCLDGQFRLKANYAFALSVSDASFTITMAGVVFYNTGSTKGAQSAFGDSGSNFRVRCNDNANTILFDGDGAGTSFTISMDVFLASKPTFVL